MEIGGEVRAVKDREIFWDIILKKQKRNYRIELDKQSGAMQIKIRKFIFWKPIDLNNVKKNAY